MLKRMASALPIPWVSPDEYLARERQSPFRSEYHDGDVFAMTGASFPHNVIAANLVGELRQRLKASPCQTVQSDLRVRIAPPNAYVYPDVAVACPPIELEDAQGDTLLNPVLIVEVLSDSTEAYDRGRKFACYRQIPSLREYLLVSQHEARVDHFRRAGDGTWNLRAVEGLAAVLQLESLGFELPLAEIYAKVELRAPPPLPVDARPSER